jgi:hypothetical protein
MTLEGAMERGQKALFFQSHIHILGNHTNHHTYGFFGYIFFAALNSTSLQIDDCDDV